jgi:hypothetical protein
LKQKQVRGAGYDDFPPAVIQPTLEPVTGTLISGPGICRGCGFGQTVLVVAGMGATTCRRCKEVNVVLTDPPYLVFSASGMTRLGVSGRVQFPV